MRWPTAPAAACLAWPWPTRAACRWLEASLWAVARTESFEAALVLAVNLGEDADTVGAVTGQFAGALYGEGGIPARWLRPLAWRVRIAALASALLELGAASILSEDTTSG